MNIPIEAYTIFLECLLTFYYFHRTLRPSYPSVLPVIGIYGCYFGLLLFTTLCIPLFPKLGLIGIFLFICYFLYLKCPALPTIYTIVLFFAAAMFADLISGFTLTRMGIPIHELMGIRTGRLIYNTTAKLIHLLLLVILSTGTQLHYDSRALMHAIPLLLCNTASIFILSVQFDSFMQSQNHTAFAVATIGMLLINIVVCSYTEIMKRTYELEKKELCMEEELLHQEKYYQDVIAHQRESRSLWHDMKKYMMAMEALVAEDQKSEANAQLLALKEKLGNLEQMIHTGNPIVDGILNYGMEKAHNANIPIHFDLWVAPSLAISPLDLYIILGNTLDNAVEACCAIPASDFPSIHCILRQKNHILFYEITNPIPASPIRKTGEIHGYGLENVKECVRRNGGLFSVHTENATFRVTVTINLRDS